MLVPDQLDRALEEPVDLGARREVLFLGQVRCVAVRDVLLLQVGLVDPGLVGIVLQERFNGGPLFDGLVGAPIFIGRRRDGDVRRQIGVGGRRRR